ncbi:glutathione S-transferase family protein [Rhizobium calliandrae]|uniref:Glutathione S-transferase family protein n=1 Tax=Rhizobium calliandrae TaxID=1312182 RepID=A0ABT7KDX3_9HYPH|nr:glutathione S-transferase family protein [Rhizobium calliandrae]MDL2406830.1 glutathione S-transferase family protein [Rhizobium calliandrae]
MENSAKNGIELLGAKTGNCIRAAIALEEVSATYSVRKIRLHSGEHKTAGYLDLNPSGQVPTLIDHNQGEQPLVLAQSNAIIFYAAEMQPDTILPVSDPRERARALERFFFFITDVVVPSNTAFLLERFGDAAGAAVLYQRSIAALAVAETYLGQHPYMAGDRFTVADIPAVTIISSMSSNIDWSQHSLLNRWYEQLMARPSVTAGMHAFD